MKIPVFKEYLSEEEVQAGLLDKTLTQGVIRVNQRNFEQCFVDNPDGEELGDLLVLGFEDRNRALHGDLVAIRVKPREAWFLNEMQCKRHNVKCIPRAPPPAALVASPSAVVATEGSGGSSPPSTKPKSKKDQQQQKQLIQPPLKSLQNHRRVADLCGEDLQRVGAHLFTKTAEVVAIVEQRASRKMVGHLKPMPGTVNFIMFSPPDSRIPRLLIPANNAPKGFNDRPQDFERYIYLVELAHWRTDSRLPVGKLLDKLGLAGDIEAEHKGLLLVNGVDLRDYDEHPELTACLPLPKVPGEWRIDEEELGRRRDFRDDVVFTIDPLTARDLDDALHIKQICRKKDDGRDGGVCWEVGVHIADVSYFLRQDTELDDWACKRGTSVYLVHQVIPMLPRILCEELCSLNPGVDRLTFSVVWHMDNDANIFHTTFCRSIIRSCAKLAYEHAQDIIDNPTKQFAIAEMPPIHCGRKIRDIKQAVRNLDAIARKLKAKRFGKGALKLELPKLRFDVEKSSTGIWQPRGIRLDERKDANFLVEEFMLLANMYVAHQTYDYFKTSALLRRHPPPKKKELKNLVDKCGKLGIHINPLSSKTLADSLKTYEHLEECKYGVMPALNQMLMKCMHLAQYFCTGLAESEHEFRHYALSVDFYTHFTSPIRRYPDVIVHRLLAASLGYCPSPGYSTEAINKIASRSNNTKTSAKVCSELSGEIFFGAIVRGSGGNFEAIAVVMSIYDGCFDVLLLKYAIIKRVYLKKQKEVVRTYFGKLDRDGAVTLVLLLKDEADDDAAAAVAGGASAIKDGSAVAAARDDSVVEYVVGGDDADEYDGLEVDDEPEMGRDGAAAVAVVAADADQQLDVPGWVSSTRAEQRQTLNMMSIVQVRLVPIKDSVKYEVNLVPTPDVRSLNWHDAREHMEV